MWTTQFIGRRIWLWIVYIVVLIGVVLIHYRSEVIDTNCESLNWTAKLWHQRLCTAGHRKPRAHYVRLVTLTAGSEPVADKCEGRKFVASLLFRLRDLGPSLIVLDKWYSPSACSDSAATAALQASIGQVSKTVPIILEQDSNTYDDLTANNDPTLTLWDKFHLQKTDEVLADSAILVDGKTSHLALARSACNNWEIPLQWTVYPPLHDIEPRNYKSFEMDTLAFATAKKFDSDLVEIMRHHVENQGHLVAAFLPLRAFHPLSATQILCGINETRYNPDTCNAEPTQDLLMKGKIVVVGEYSDKDWYQSVVGNVPGFLLQANYMESLLDDRYYQLIPKWLEIILTILCFILVDIAVERARNPHIGAFLSLAAVACLWAISHFAIMEWGYYFTFWFPMGLAVLAKWLEAANKIPKAEAKSPLPSAV